MRTADISRSARTFPGPLGIRVAATSGRGYSRGVPSMRYGRSGSPAGTSSTDVSSTSPPPRPTVTVMSPPPDVEYWYGWRKRNVPDAEYVREARVAPERPLADVERAVAAAGDAQLQLARPGLVPQRAGTARPSVRASRSRPPTTRAPRCRWASPNVASLPVTASAPPRNSARDPGVSRKHDGVLAHHQLPPLQERHRLDEHALAHVEQDGRARGIPQRRGLVRSGRW